MMTENFTLPAGVKQIDMGDLILHFSPDKIVVIFRNSPEHYTLEFGNHSGVLDVHKTTRSGEGKEFHETLFAISHISLKRFLTDAAQLIPMLTTKVQRLRPGWIRHHGIALINMTRVSQFDLSGFEKRGRRLVPRIDQKSGPISERDIYSVSSLRNDGAYLMLKPFRKGWKPIGHAFRITDSRNEVRLLWIKNKDIEDFAKFFLNALLARGNDFSIPPGHIKPSENEPSNGGD